MIASIVVLTLVTAQRLGELVLARRNTRRLLARGGREFGADHYPLLVLLHGAWLAGLWILAWNKPVIWPWLAAFAVLQALRVWVIASLGGRWTTRIIVLPGEPLIRRGPYRFLPHPNYMVVAGEIAILPLAFGLVPFAVAFSLANAAILAIRLRAETRALHEGLSGPSHGS
ncbi:MAG: isoprenylcysteine carboxylmethyltransferase family protein [Caulobacteraceae bacterium]